MPMWANDKKQSISIHTLRGEGDAARAETFERLIDISIHTLRGEGDEGEEMRGRRGRDISIHTLRGEGDITGGVDAAATYAISIHTLRGEGDKGCQKCLQMQQNFNPHPPWGGRLITRLTIYRTREFQSTPSVGRATESISRLETLSRNFNPHPPWGGRLIVLIDV